jgi:hypothetical protein
VNDPTCSADFKRALEVCRGCRLDGVGFVFTKDGPYVGIDLDRCRDATTGVLEPWAQDIVRELDTYVEVSPSGTGIKLIVRGKLPKGARNRKGQLEVYSKGRFFTITGHHLEETPWTIEERQSELERLHARMLESGAAGEDRQSIEVPMSDDEVIAAAHRAANGDKFARLWRGDVTGFDSASEADLALCGMLAYWTGPEAGRIADLFDQSGLATREKWAKRKDYRKRTIKKAIAGCREFARPSTTLTSGSRSNQRIRSIQEQPGHKHTSTPDGMLPSKGMKRMGEATPTPSGSDRLEQRGEGVESVIDLANTLAKAPDWEASFTLARRLRTISDSNPEQFEAAVGAFCETSGRPTEEFWYAFLACWDKVRMAEGDDVFAWAAEESKKFPYRPTPSPGAKYAHVASMAYHLSRHTDPDRFFLPRVRLAELLGVTAQTISNIVNLMTKNGLIKCVDSEYSYRDGKAKEYRFVGPPR